jgi:hypothetical protein
MSKSLATFATQPLIVAKVGLQSRPPASRNGKPFKSFVEVMSYIVEHEGALSLFKGIGPQLLKGLMVQGLLMMTKERYVMVFPVMRLETNRLRQSRTWIYPPLPLRAKAASRAALQACGRCSGESRTCRAHTREIDYYVQSSFFPCTL